jgi:hypothetical protein
MFYFMDIFLFYKKDKMASTAIMIMIIVTTIVIFAVTAVVLSLVVLKSAPKRDVPRPNTSSIGYITQGPTLWTENTRQNNTGENGMPPCYEVSPACKKIYGIINGRRVVQRYQRFLDCLSIMCCQRLNSANAKDCSKVLTGERLQDLVDMGGDPYDRDAVAKAKAYTNVENTSVGKLIVAGINIIDRHLAVMANDNDLTQEEKGAIKGFINEFYGANLETIYKLCF